MSEPRPEIEIKDEINTYTIDLNKPDGFNRNEFIEKIKSFNGPAAKWLVLEDKLTFFPFFTQHEKVFELTSKESEDKLESAGIFMMTQENEKNRLRLFSFSPSLSGSGLLSKNDSDQYKNETLIHKLKAMDSSFEIGT
ncbi:MAG: hypothetical protein Q8P53_01350 [Candidatus Shapirobacteria bacterium]|nr:hypothetical protein [Candidatus Shapirobacteria bacterium]